MKKSLSILLSILMLATSLNLFVLAADEPTAGTCGENVSWRFDPASGTLTLSGTGAVDEFPLVEKEILNEETGGTYTQRQPTPPWEAWRDQIAAVEVEEGVTLLPGWCFARLPVLKTASLANSLTDLGVGCFSDCAALEEANLPENLTTLIQTFVGCANLRQVMTLPESLQTTDFAFAASGVTTVVLPGNMKNLDDVCFRDAENLTTVLVGKGIARIGMMAFQRTGIKTLIVPDTVTQLGNELCQSCKALTSVYLPDGIKEIPINAFGVCTSLKQIRLPGDLETISAYAFNNCNQLDHITIPATVTSIGDGAFNFCASLMDVYYQGTEEQWNEVEISDAYNDPLKNATVHFNAEAEPDFYLTGDVNGNGEISAEDARLTLRAAVGLEQYEEGGLQAICCDYNLDGYVTAADARLTLRAAVGLAND